MLDRIFAACLLLCILPLLLPLLLLVYIEDGGPVFLTQIRVGKDSVPFLFYKIRTMKRETPNVASKDLEDVEKYLLKTGYFFRKYSLDEIPNILNIVKGDMKFIGPRPLIPSEENMHVLRRNYGITNLKPGITGWAQVNGRDIMTDERKIVLERYYLQNKSLSLDIRILLRTVVSVFKASGVRF